MAVCIENYSEQPEQNMLVTFAYHTLCEKDHAANAKCYNI